jgi:hypothetical protein
MRVPRFASMLLFSAIVTAPLIGCADGARTIAAPDAPTLSRSIVTSRPISGVCTTTFVPPAFPPPLTFQQVDVGTCQLSHLGRAAIYSVQEINIVAGTQTSVIYTYTAANGDVLRAVNVGANTPNGAGVSFSATTTFVGGTGRFAHATGEAHIEGSASFITNTATYTLDGWIAYDARDAGGQ